MGPITPDLAGRIQSGLFIQQIITGRPLHASHGVESSGTASVNEANVFLPTWPSHQVRLDFKLEITVLARLSNKHAGLWLLTLRFPCFCSASGKPLPLLRPVQFRVRGILLEHIGILEEESDTGQ